MVKPLKRRARLLLVPAALVLAAGLAATACGGGGDEGGTPGGESPTDGGDATFDVSMGDNFFEPKDLTVKAGEQVTLNLKNDGTAAHTFRFAGPDNQYNTDDDLISDPFLINAGELQAVTFTAPDQPGTYDLKCEVHPPDMIGTLTVL